MSLRYAIVKQFRRPEGALGHIAAAIMATRPSNIARNRWTVDLLSLDPGHRVLEIGCGPGLALRACAHRLSDGCAIGIDHSAVMVQQARHRLAQEIGLGVLEVRRGDANCLADEPPVYDRVFSLNVVQFLPNLRETFRHVHGCLVPGGIVATTYHPRSRSPTRDEAITLAAKVSDVMFDIGFVDIELHELPLEPVPAICVTGIKTDESKPKKETLKCCSN